MKRIYRKYAGEFKKTGNLEKIKFKKNVIFKFKSWDFIYFSFFKNTHHVYSIFLITLTEFSVSTTGRRTE